MTVKVLILEDNPVARGFLCRVVRESFSDPIAITEAGDLDHARRQINLTGGARGLHGVDPLSSSWSTSNCPTATRYRSPSARTGMARSSRRCAAVRT